MREILFRTWDKRTLKYLTDAALINGVRLYYKYETFSLQSNDNLCIGDDVIIEQYIGLTDKNGVKIFEGDILAGNDIHKGISGELWGYTAVFFNGGKFDCNYQYGLDGALASDFTVVGNIHENPELLEGGGNE